MKKILMYILSCLLSFVIMIISFDMLSWYNSFDIPTKVVLVRMIICFTILELIFIFLISLYNKKNK
ncbi:unknown [Coprobacillus sp. CAG:605]|nr:unknown [Coprobacillus sp. CAG:605]